MSAPDDWQVGDLALCVSGQFDPSAIDCGWAIKLGMILTVCEVGCDEAGLYSARWVWLNFEEDPTRDEFSAWEAICFRKIRPLSPHEHLATIAELAADKIINAPVEA